MSVKNKHAREMPGACPAIGAVVSRPGLMRNCCVSRFFLYQTPPETVPDANGDEQVLRNGDGVDY